MDESQSQGTRFRESSRHKVRNSSSPSMLSKVSSDGRRRATILPSSVTTWHTYWISWFRDKVSTRCWLAAGPRAIVFVPALIFMCVRVKWDSDEYEKMSSWDLESIDNDIIGGAVPVVPEEIQAMLYQP